MKTIILSTLIAIQLYVIGGLAWPRPALDPHLNCGNFQICLRCPKGFHVVSHWKADGYENTLQGVVDEVNDATKGTCELGSQK